MDTQTIDMQYSQLQNQSKQTVGEISTLAEKLRGAAQSGNQAAREWMLDLKQIALAVRAEQNQVAALLQALHGFVASQVNQAPLSAPPQPAPRLAAPQPSSAPAGEPHPQPGFPPPGYPQQAQGSSGMLGNFLKSGFGKAVTMGAGFGVGDTLINDIFGGFGRRGCCLACGMIARRARQDGP